MEQDKIVIYNQETDRNVFKWYDFVAVEEDGSLTCYNDADTENEQEREMVAFYPPNSYQWVEWE